MTTTVSNPTAVALIQVMERAFTHSQLDLLFLRLDAQHVDSDGAGMVNKISRLQPLVEYLRDQEGEPDVITLIRIVIEEKYKDNFYDYSGKPKEFLEPLVRGLKTDGYEIVEGQLVATTPDPAALAPQITFLERALGAHGFNVALSHYQQAVSSYTDGRLEASNGQLRSFLDDLAQSLCRSALGERANDAKSAADKLFSRKLIDGDENRLLAGLAGISNWNGAHAGLTDPEEALFRLHMTTATARYLIARILPVTKRAAPAKNRT